MTTAQTVPQNLLYESDETAWLELTAELIRLGRLDEVEWPHLAEYLADMAARDRREVQSRLALLLTHTLKWTYEPGQRSKSWKGTIIEQQHGLEDLMRRGVLRNHAEAVLAEMYGRAVARAAAETGLAADTFPAACPYTLDQLLSDNLIAE